MTAPKEVVNLVERFDLHRDAYKSGKYKETQLRREFIDPFFKALGWDVENKEGRAEAYKDVIHEDAIKIGGATKAPDYCFRIGGNRKFFLEAKEPSVNIEETPRTAYQLRRYAWSAKLPLSILTDFEEFAVYDCRTRPVKDDKASTARVMYLTYDQYITRWDEIGSIFSRDAVVKGAYDKYVESSKKKRGTEEVDDAFLKEIEKWRDLLARNIALRNPKLSQHELNFAVQRTIDRIIFLRICEDRSIEDYNHLMGICNGANIYKRLCEYFYHADERYNSGLFHFQKEKGRPGYDELTPHLNIDDAALKKIIGSLYYPDSPYEFSILPASILGQVYEQFLGKVIYLTEGHRAKIEDKPEVKKAGGVYYTPEYIVDYIVDNTLVKMLEGKTPKQVEKIKILDPACGSGSFLINAYQKLIDWHRDYYEESKDKKHKALIYEAPGGEMKLVTTEKKRILLKNIFGVDIDSQAVEVTKLSLLLKVLEGETDQTINAQLKLFHERALPDLADNIKCGNSLIGPDFYDGQQMSLLGDDERRRINTFDWNAEFPDIMKSGGFDVVIGNPPYGASFGEKEEQYFSHNYRVFSGVKDVYTCFIERSLLVLNNSGRHSFIVPSAWLGGPKYKRLRELLLPQRIDAILLLPFDVFKDAYVDTAVFVVTKQNADTEHETRTRIYPKRERLTVISLMDNHYKFIRQSAWTATEDKKIILNLDAVYLLNKIRKQIPNIFADTINIKRGVLFDKGLLSKKKSGPNSYRYFEGNIYRYRLNLIADQWVEFGDKMKERPKEFFWFKGPRLLLRRLVNRRQRMMATLASDTFITNKNLYSILAKDESLHILAVLGVLNSRLISYIYINQVTQATKDDFPQVTIKDVRALPFPDLCKDKSRHDKLVELVEQILLLNKTLSLAHIGHEKTALQRQIDATDRQIDKLVYELYGLTEEEVKIVQETVK